MAALCLLWIYIRFSTRCISSHCNNLRICRSLHGILCHKHNFLLSVGGWCLNPNVFYFYFSRFLSAWFLSYASTLPLIYFLVFNIQNTKSVIPIILAISSLSVTFPNLVASFSAENQVSLQVFF